MRRLEIDSHLELRLLQEEDAPHLFTLAEQTRSELERWLPDWSNATSSVEECRSLARHSLQRHAVSGTHVCGVRHRGRLVGAAGLSISEPWRAEIGYWLGSDHRGKGIMTRSARSLLDYAFHAQRMAEVVIRCDEGNVKASAIPERLGLDVAIVGRSTLQHPPHRVYSLSFADWAARR